MNPNDREFVDECERVYLNPGYHAAERRLLEIIHRQNRALEKCKEQRDLVACSHLGHDEDITMMNKELNAILEGKEE